MSFKPLPLSLTCLTHLTAHINYHLNFNRCNVLCIQKLNNTVVLHYAQQCHLPHSQTTIALPTGMQCWNFHYTDGNLYIFTWHHYILCAPLHQPEKIGRQQFQSNKHTVVFHRGRTTLWDNKNTIPEVLTVVKMLMLIFSVVTPCGLLGRKQHFRETYQIYPQLCKYKQYVPP